MKAYAYVVGPQDMAWTALFDMASELGFGGVSSYRGIAQAEQQVEKSPVCYFLFSSVHDIRSLREQTDAIRFSSRRHLRFSPMIYFTQNPSVETIMACINMGFDDVIALPHSVSGLRERLLRQTNQQIVFYETEGYFGPDRRNRIARRQSMGVTRVGGPFRRLEIIRNVAQGIEVLRDEFNANPPLVTQMHASR